LIRVCSSSYIGYFANLMAVIYYAPIIFQSLGLTGSTISLLASGVVGIINVATTVPAIYYIDRIGRKPLMMTGSAGMCICEMVIGIIVATCGSDWTKHVAAGWVAVGKSPPSLQNITPLTYSKSLFGSTSSTLHIPGAQDLGYSSPRSSQSPFVQKAHRSAHLRTG